MLGSAENLTRGRLLARNVALNFGGWAFPAVIGLLAIPSLVRAMGAERFGLLALAWTLVGPFSPFDLGIGRALTQALAERVGREDQADSPEIAWSAGWLLLAVGSASGFVVLLAARTLIERYLHVSPSLWSEATRGVRLLALAIPLTVLTSGLRGVLEAGQAFRAVNALRVPLAVLSFAGPWAVQRLSHSLPTSILVLVLARLLVLALHAVVVTGMYPELRRPRAARGWALRSLWRVGGWITVSTLATPILATGDRFLIGAALPVSALAQYAAVTEVALKLTVVGGVLQPVLFSALAATLVLDPARARALFDRAVRVAAVLVAPPAIVLVAFAPEGLGFWLGADLARTAVPVLQLVAIGAFLNTFAQIALVALQAAGRADLPAKLHVLEVPLYLVTLWLLLSRFGLLGAALAFMLRMLVDTTALFSAVLSVLRDSGREIRRALGLAFGGALALAACASGGSRPSRAALAAGVLGIFAVGAYRRLLTPDERAVAGAWVARVRGTRARVVAADAA